MLQMNLKITSDIVIDLLIFVYIVYTGFLVCICYLSSSCEIEGHIGICTLDRVLL